MDNVGQHEAQVTKYLVELTLLAENIFDKLIPSAGQNVQNGNAEKREEKGKMLTNKLDMAM